MGTCFGGMDWARGNGLAVWQAEWWVRAYRDRVGNCGDVTCHVERWGRGLSQAKVFRRANG
jgi:hypothetical protein